METKLGRIEKRVQVLRAIKDGKKFSRADKVLRPLVFGDLISVKYFGDVIDQVTLTPTGEVYLAFYEKEVKVMAEREKKIAQLFQ